MKLKREFRVFGPPGTGKTTYLTKQIQRAFNEVGMNKVLVASFSKSAVQELISRNLSVKERKLIRKQKNFGTLHSIAYSLLSKEIKVVETPEYIEIFNKKNPELSISLNNVQSDVLDETPSYSPKTQGDKLFNEMMLNRAKMIPIDEWRPAVRDFYYLWKDFTIDMGGYDFTGLIEFALNSNQMPINNILVGYFDEAQDFTRLELALIRKWGENFDYVLVGDDDQCIYSFKGAKPEDFINPPIDNKQQKILTTSYRVPQVINDYATKWIQQVKTRQYKKYFSVEKEGEIRKINLSLKNTTQLIQLAESYTKEGKSVMFLTTCAYQLIPLINKLKKEGIPYWNPYRRNRLDWNPLTYEDHEGKLTFGERISHFLKVRTRGKYFNKLKPEDFAKVSEEMFQGILLDSVDIFEMDEDESFVDAYLLQNKYWTLFELKAWMDLIKDVFKRGIVKELKEIEEDLDKELYGNDLKEKFKSKTDLIAALQGDVNFIKRHLKSQWKKSSQYIFKILEKHDNNTDVLLQKPRIIVSTIHASKGGEADVVIVFPDLSPVGMKEFKSNPDIFYRLFYVAFTRAKHSLLLGRMSSPYFVRWM